MTNGASATTKSLLARSVAKVEDALSWAEQLCDKCRNVDWNAETSWIDINTMAEKQSSNLGLNSWFSYAPLEHDGPGVFRERILCLHLCDCASGQKDTPYKISLSWGFFAYLLPFSFLSSALSFSSVLFPSLPTCLSNVPIVTVS